MRLIFEAYAIPLGSRLVDWRSQGLQVHLLYNTGES